MVALPGVVPHPRTPTARTRPFPIHAVLRESCFDCFRFVFIEPGAQSELPENPKALPKHGAELPLLFAEGFLKVVLKETIEFHDRQPIAEVRISH